MFKSIHWLKYLSHLNVCNFWCCLNDNSMTNSWRARQVIGVPKAKAYRHLISVSFIFELSIHWSGNAYDLSASSLRQQEQNGLKHPHHTFLNDAIWSGSNQMCKRFRISALRINLIGRKLHWRLTGSIDSEERHIEHVCLRYGSIKLKTQSKQDKTKQMIHNIIVNSFCLVDICMVQH